MRRWPDAKKRRFVLPDGREVHGWQAAADALGVTMHAVQRRATWDAEQQAYLVRPPAPVCPPRPDIDEAAVVAAYLVCRSVSAVARRLRCSHQTVRARLVRAGLIEEGASS